MVARFNVLTIGDALITMNPMTTGPMRYVTEFERKIGGAELNFAIGIARLGLSSKWIGRLGKDEFGKVIYNFSRGEGIDVTDVKLVEGLPTSLNFKEIRDDGSGKTFYYRSNSPILTLEPTDITDEMFEKVDLIHLTGVYLSIDKKNRFIVNKIMEMARKYNITISFDPNIRLKLWSIEEAREVYKEILPSVDILLTGLDEIRLITEKDSQDDLSALAHEYNIRDLVIKDGGNGSMLYRDGEWTKEKAFDIKVIDTVGAGDGFDAGYVFGFLNNYNPKELLRFANGVGALVTTVSGDNEGLPYLEEVKAFINNEPIIER
jgi:2-dehydro-3-deoxygluconokinase